ncbi:hypothetical protein [Microbacterium sufflavum]
MSERSRWREWMAATDDELHKLTGLRSDRLVRWDYLGAFDDGLSPEDAAARAAVEAD